jgi:LAS superfamily LD-carboxypeptidase LdcB
VTRPKKPARPTRRARRAPDFDALEVTGRARTHVVALEEPHCTLHRAVARPFLRMRAAAKRVGIDLVPASSFRDFDTQLRIWNEKWTGRRELVDRGGRRLAARTLAPAARVAAILAWSAPPGASRHHWGTDLDVYDRAAVPAGYALGLVPAEYAEGGPFAALSAWLEANMGRFGFYRPYRRDHGGVAPEPWHLSHAPTARAASARLTLATLREALAGAELEGRAALLKELPGIYARYVRTVDRPPRRRASKRAK